MAIEAGDERFATNKLADLVAGEDPEHAKELYEMAIEAGEEQHGRIIHEYNWKSEWKYLSFQVLHF